MTKALCLISAIALAGCASTAMKQYVGESVTEAVMRLGPPENAFDLPDGRRAFQWHWGGGAVVVPGHTAATVAPVGSVAVVNATSTPAYVAESDGCLVTLIAKPVGNDYRVEEYRIPKRLVC
ncbi:conserved hypothetical protein [Novosphingobium aromaticivorans DSM 12444]|jgi:hypothetical protein|uniref:Lipoprotein n=1 Tax=Novosphingobium aromaticivorans (strain ATCC 700278 / DSM 12444 / CCUG 56034 / CIP 105152 / NBRC 16084 / F199) TaxID=279238 RepID=Q2G3X2_NOVAD|nr:hypothetical protein [Novosphingobium aromaticivorans]ABD27451.1 conserved hypothetical protein [Novosphingobium aromaticivorans DSM 12444]SCY69631.1 hypothetical protein SAMN05660666_02525 [Novosphingobium aromaticivorans]